MTDTPQGNSEIADYQLAVERQLLDLPAPIREDLLNGLEEHLAEVSAEREPGVTLEDLLGSPETYARELRETVEVRRERLGDRFRRTVVEPLANRTRGAADRFTTSAGMGEAAEARQKLKPGWWVLRGLLVTFLLVFWFEGQFYGGVSGFMMLVFTAIALLFVWLSIRLGVRSERWGRNPRRILATAGAGLFAVMAWGFYWGGVPNLGGGVYETGAVSYYDEYEYVTDVYAYTEDGEALYGVYLFDQNGDPLWLGNPDECVTLRENPFEQPTGYEEPTDYHDTMLPEEETRGDYGYLYPLCDRPAEEPTDEGSESPTAEPTEELTDRPTDAAPTTEEATPTPEPSE